MFLVLQTGNSFNLSPVVLHIYVVEGSFEFDKCLTLASSRLALFAHERLHACLALSLQVLGIVLTILPFGMVNL